MKLPIKTCPLIQHPGPPKSIYHACASALARVAVLWACSRATRRGARHVSAGFFRGLLFSGVGSKDTRTCLAPSLSRPETDSRQYRGRSCARCFTACLCAAVDGCEPCCGRETRRSHTRPASLIDRWRSLALACTSTGKFCSIP